MQETCGIDGKYWQEFFSGKSEEELTEKMDTRLAQLQEKGETLVRRISVSRNQPCPCGSGRKFKKCCISKTDEQIARFMERGQ